MKAPGMALRLLGTRGGVVTLAVAVLIGCSPDIQRWHPREEDIIALHREYLEAERAGHRGSTLASISEKLFQHERLRAALEQREPVAEPGAEPTSAETDRDANADADAGREGLLSLEREFTSAVWSVGPEEFYGALRIRGRRANLDADDPQDRRELELLKDANQKKLYLMYRDEYEEIDEAQGGAENHRKRIGLALSGGGIRSASFAAGVLQGLYELEELHSFGYLSTVSGGGYAGGWYLFQDRPDELFAPGSFHLQHLAQNGNYLVGSHFSDRGPELALKLGVHLGLVPLHWLLNGVFDLDRNVYGVRDFYRRGLERGFLYDSAHWFSTKEKAPRYGPLADLSPLTRGRKPFWIINMHVAINDEVSAQRRNRTGDAFEITPLRAGADAVGYVHVSSFELKRPVELVITLAALYSEGKRGASPVTDPSRQRLWSAVQERLRAALQSAFRAELKRETLRRRGDRSLEAQSARNASPRTRETLRAGFGELLDRISRFDEILPDVTRDEAESLRGLRSDILDAFDAGLAELDDSEAANLATAPGGLRIFGARSPRDVLRDLTLRVWDQVWNDAELQLRVGRLLKSLAKEPRLHEFLAPTPAGQKDPGAIEDAATALAGSRYRPKRTVLAANFALLEALFDGELVVTDPPNWMRPNYAMAISGAAVDSQSLQQGALVDLVTNVFNYDLGFMIDSWADGWLARDHHDRERNFGFYVSSPVLVYKPLSFLTPVVHAVASWFDADATDFHFGERWHDYTQRARRFRLTDGGHFDNTGIYALVRRGCRLIIVSDATYDPEVNRWNELSDDERMRTFADLRELEKKLYSDFGAEIEIEWNSFATADLIAQSGVPLMLLELTISNLPFRIDEENELEEVKILLLKACYDPFFLTDRASFVEAEKAASPAFPDEPTFEQMYSERKVLAYRRLAREAVLRNRSVIVAELERIRAAYASGGE